METMASHTIPIISKLKVYEDILVNEENALILNKTNKSKLSKKILYVIDNYEKLSKKIINNNNKLVLDKYNFQTQIEKIIDLYM
jgi:glycosyltransferase involved in cell wall biosynthesis